MIDYIAEANRFMYDDRIDESEQMPSVGSAFGKPKKKKSHIETLKQDKEDLEDSLKIAKKISQVR